MYIFGWVDTYSLELVYSALFMVACLAAMFLGRWTTKRLLLFICVVAVLLAVAKASRQIIKHVPRTYTVEVQTPV